MNELNIINSEVVTVEDKDFFNNQIDLIINQHKNNRQTINRLVFDSMALLTDADTASDTLAGKGFFRRLIGSFTGSNRKLETIISQNRSKAQYLAQQTLQKLAEQNLLSFDLIVSINNKLNLHMEAISKEVENIYNGLNNFFELYQNNIIQTELRLDKVERNLNLLTWGNSIEYQMLNGINYFELDETSQIVCIAKDFYNLTKGEWSVSDLLLLKSVLNQIGIVPTKKVNLWEVILRINESEILREKLLGEKIFISSDIIDNNLIILESLYKFNLLLSEEKYLVTICKKLLNDNNISINDNSIESLLTKSYIEVKNNINLDNDMSIFDFILELLFNLSQGDDFINSQFNVDENSEKLNLIDVDQASDFDNVDNELLSDGITAFNDKIYSLSFDKFSDAYKLGNLSAGYYLAYSYLYGLGTSVNYEKTLEIANQCLEENEYDLLFILGKLYHDGLGVNQNFDLAYENYTKSINKSNNDMAKAFSMNNLGSMFLLGEGVRKDIDKALDYFERSAELGNDTAMLNLGLLYFNGELIDRNYQVAFEYFNNAATKFNGKSFNMLGYYYEVGLLGNQDVSKAIECYKKSYENGFVKAAYNCARFFENGIGVPTNYEEAFKLYKIAADADIPFALLKVSACYSKGMGTERDLNKSCEASERFNNKGIMYPTFGGAFSTFNCRNLDDPLL